MATTPSSLSDLVFWLDASDQSTVTDANGDGKLERLTDKAGHGHDASEASSDRQPQILADAFNGRDALVFDGVNDRLNLADSSDLNIGGPYTGKTVLMAVKTGGDVEARQTLYEQGGASRGLSIYVEGGTLYMGAWNRIEAPWGPQQVTTTISADTAYVITLVFDQEAGIVEGFVDGTSIGTVSGVGLLYRHGNNIGIGATVENSYFHDGSFVGNGHHFQGLIGEVAYYNKALADEARGDVEAYLEERWQGPPNQRPVASDDTGATDQNTPITIDLMANDSDGDSDPISIQSVDTSGTTGNVVIDGAAVTYDPNGKFNYLGAGQTSTDFFRYVLADGRGGTDDATVAVLVTGINDAPAAVNDELIPVAWGEATAIEVLNNDSDPDFSDAPVIVAAGGAANGSLAVSDGLLITYTPNAGFAGTDQFTYTISDGNGGSDTATVTVDVALPPPPDSQPDLVMWLDAGDETSLAAIGNAAAGLTDKSGHGNDASQATSGYQPRIVSAGINGRDALAFDGVDDRLAIADSEDINVGGPYSGKTLALVFKTGADVASRQMLYEQGGFARGINVYIDDGTLYLNAWNTREQVWGPSFAKTAITADTVYTAMLVYDSESGSVEGVVNGSSIGRVDGVDLLYKHGNNTGLGATIENTYFHDGEFLGNGHHFNGLIGEFAQYNRALSATDLASLGDYFDARWQFNTNHAPVASDVLMTTNEAGRKVIDLRQFAADPDGDPLAVQSIDNSGTVGEVALQTDEVVYDPSGRFTYLERGDTVLDTFRYTVSDGRGGTDTATVTMMISGINEAPTAVDDGPVSTAAGTSVNIAVLANDFDPNPNATLSVVVVGEAYHGSVWKNADNTVTFQPDADFIGTDEFLYYVADQYGASDYAMVTVNVHETPDAQNDHASINVNAATNVVTGNVLDNDEGIVDGSLPAVSSSGQFAGRYGVLTLNPDGSYSYALDKTNAAVTSMAYGDVLAETFDYVIRDPAIADAAVTASAVLAIDIASATEPLGWRVPQGVGRSGDQGIDSLLYGNKWSGSGEAGTVVTYSFGGEQSVYDPYYRSGEPTKDFGALTDDQKSGIRKALEEWSSVADITFVEVLDSDTVAGDIRFARSSVPSTAHAYLPSSSQEAGDVWISYRGSYLNMSEGTYGFETGLHEIGHALGLVHPHTAAGRSVPLPTALDWVGVSVMSYSSFPGANQAYGSYSQLFYPDTPMINDIAAIQYIYGANTSHNQGDTIYSWAPGERILETIWDAGGNDQISWANQSSDAVINLTPGEWSEVGPAYVIDAIAHPDVLESRTLMIAHDVVIENAVGGSGNDEIYGNQFANLLEGGFGNDLLVGLGGGDVLDGGAGDDIFEISDAAFTEIVGGTGTDLIRLGIGAQVLDLTAGLVSGIEAIDLGGAGNSLILDQNAVLDITDNGDPLTILGGQADGLELRGSWDIAGQSRIDGTLFDTFTSGAAVLLAEASVGAGLADSGVIDDEAVAFVNPDPVEPLSDALHDAAVLSAETTAVDDHSGFLGGITHLGTDAADSLVGTEWADVMVGQAGDDVIHGQGGRDGLAGNAGDDLLIAADNDFQRIDGGSGQDRFQLDWSDGLLDLSGAGGDRLLGIEEIDLAGGFNQLELDLATLSRLAAGTGRLEIMGDATNSVAVSLGAEFTVVAETGFVTYSDGDVMLTIVDAINQEDILIG